MAPTHLTHLSLASPHRSSIAFFLLICTIFVVPFLSFSTPELVPPALSSIAYTLWDSLLAILTSSAFYFFLLNFLIVALVFSSGILDPSSSARREFDGIQEGDLHQRGIHDYSTAAQIIHERLALDELYESQAPSLSYLNVAESSRIYVADDGTIVGNGYGDEGETQNGKGKQIMGNPIDSFLHQRPGFSSADGGNASEEGSSGSRTDATEGFLPTGSMVGDESHKKKMSPVFSVVVKSEIVDLHDTECKEMHAKDIQGHGKNLHPESEVDQDADADVHARLEHRDIADAINNTDNDTDKGSNEDVIQDEDGNDLIHDKGGDGDTDDGKEHIDHEGNGIEAGAEGEGKRRRQRRIVRIPSEPVIAGTIHSQQRENVGAGMGGRCMSLERVEKLAEGMILERQREKAGEGEELMMMSMSREELNERASAFISAFRKKLAIDDVSGQM